MPLPDAGRLDGLIAAVLLFAPVIVNEMHAVIVTELTCHLDPG